MKALIQRVSHAAVSIEGITVGEIGRGEVVFVGIARGDTEQDIKYLADKIINLRIFPDEQGKLNWAVRDIEGELLVISQFTLLADARKGCRPSFVAAAPPEEAQLLFEHFVVTLRGSGLKVETGKFQQHMLVEIHNDGPVTILLDSRQ